MGEENRMKKVVFFTDKEKLSDALENFNLKSFENKKIPLKLHMGEIKNKYFLRPKFVGYFTKILKEHDMDPYLYDTTVAYKGLRHTKSGYKKLAKIHGFTKKRTGCDVVIDDSGKNVKIENRNFEVAAHIFDSTNIVALSHVKGHNASGFGAAIKNFGMGGVTKETKMKIHNSSKPVHIKDKCTFCGVCSEVCPFNAIKVKKNEWKISNRKCFGCGVCVENCKEGGIIHKDANFQYLLACAAKACVHDKNVIYLNELKRISKSCDCDPFAGPIICPDIGYLVSNDPVAIDKASLDLINDKKPDIFKKENYVDPEKQITYGEKIGLGSTNYQLVEI